VFDLTQYDTQLGQRGEVKDRVKGMCSIQNGMIRSLDNGEK